MICWTNGLRLWRYLPPGWVCWYLPGKSSGVFVARNEMIAAMHKAEARIRASLSGQVRVYTREEIDVIAKTLEPPRVVRSDPYFYGVRFR